MVVLEAQADATLIEHPAGLLAKGKGPHLAVGRTNQPAHSRRRSVLRFDVAAALPRLERQPITPRPFVIDLLLPRPPAAASR